MYNNPRGTLHLSVLATLVMSTREARGAGDASSSSSTSTSTTTTEVDKALFTISHFTVGQICEGGSAEVNLPMTKSYVHAMNELAMETFKLISQDSESFARHAGRTEVNASDVLLCARRNERLSSELMQALEEVKKAERDVNTK